MQPDIARSAPKHLRSAALWDRPARVMIDRGTIVRNRGVGKRLHGYGLAVSGDDEPKPNTSDRVTTDTATLPDMNRCENSVGESGDVSTLRSAHGHPRGYYIRVAGAVGVVGPSRGVALLQSVPQQLAAVWLAWHWGGSCMYRILVYRVGRQPQRSSVSDGFKSR